jgi:hypothetical protein
MRHRLIRRALPVLLTAALAGGAAPADASPPGGEAEWVMVAESVAPTSLDLEIHLLGVATPKAVPACQPKEKGIHVYSLTETTWMNTSTGEIAYEWRASGSVYATTDCASSVRVTVEITDYAAGGKPPVVHGQPSPAPSGPPQNGRYTATANASAWVPYYVPAAVYQRGPSIVEVKVTGYYWNPSTRREMPIGCQATYTSVYPTPLGPQYLDSSQPSSC